MSKIGIIYATNSKMLRAIWVPDHESEFAGYQVRSGETLLVVDRPPRHDIATCQAIIKQHTGVDPPHYRCAVVHPELGVVTHIMADPEIDSVPGHTLVITHNHQEPVR